MNEERKDEIGKLFLLNKETDIDELKSLEIQEIIFLIFSARHLKQKQSFLNDNFDEKVKVFFDVLKEKIKNAEELYIAYDKNTNYPYIDNDNRIWMFSREEYGMKAKDYFAHQLISLNMKRIDNEEIIQNFAKLHALGIKKIIIDNGEYNIEINRDDILPPPDWSTTPKINIPIINPDLQYSMIRFFQELYLKSNYEGKEKILHNLEEKMLDEVLEGKYLIPMKLKTEEAEAPEEEGIVTLKKDTIMEFANLVGEDDTVWQPAFTDWEEFEKVYDKDVWSGNIVTYDDLLTFSEKMEGVVINSKGVCLRINENNKKMIEGYKKEKNNLKSSSVTEETIKKDTEIIVGEPKEYPSKMIEAIKEYMKKEKCIKKAYLRLMIKDKEKSYLIIVDFDGDDKKRIFQDIGDIAHTFLNEMFLDMSEMNDWARKVTKDVEPFYKKKLFRFF